MTPKRIIQKIGFAYKLSTTSPILNIQKRADTSSSKKISVLGCPPIYRHHKERFLYCKKYAINKSGNKTLVFSFLTTCNKNSYAKMPLIIQK